MRRGLALATALVMSSGCSWVFQERLPSNYKPKYQPRCSTSKGLVVLDGVFAVLNGLTVVAELANPARTTQDDALLLGGAIWTVVHMASGVSGSRWADHCRDAQDAWDADDGDARELLHHQARVRRTLDDQPRVPVAPPPSPVPSSTRPPAPAPRGFYCASSPSLASVGACARAKDACLRASAVLAAATPDLSRCALVETAYCFDAGSGDAEDSCAPTADACAIQRERAIDDAARVGDCVETK